MGVPLLFTPSGPVDLIVKPLSGLWLGDDVFLGDGLFLDEGLGLELFGAEAEVVAHGVTVSVVPEPLVLSGAEAVLEGVEDVVVAVDPLPLVLQGAEATFTGLPTVVSVDPQPLVLSAPVPETSGGLLLILIPSVRELPPLRISHEIETPAGRFFRWSPDERDPANVPSGERFSDTMPGGFETADCTLPRKTNIDYSDLERLSTWRVYGAGGELAWEGRLERAPRVSGDEMAVSPSAVGWQAHLEDNKSAREIFVDIDQSRWTGAASQRRIDAAGSFRIIDPSTAADDTTGQPALRTAFQGAWGAQPGLPLVEAWYDAGPGVEIGSLYYAWKNGGNVNALDANWGWDGLLTSTDIAPSSGDSTGNLRASGPGTGTLSATTLRRHAVVRHYYTAGPAGGDGVEYTIAWTVLAVYGNHGLPKRGGQTTTSTQGFLASDVVAYAVRGWAPLLTVSVGTTGTVQPSSFVIPQLAFLEPTTAAEIVRQASRFELPFWGVWDNKTFHWDPGREPRKRWRARIGPARLEETGPQVDRLWNSIMVQYQDVDGTARIVGPPGSGSNTEDAALIDSDPDNPANRLGIVRRDLLQMGTSTAAGAIEIGRRFLEESKRLDGSGRAQLVGHVEDDRGVLHPYWKVRAGDSIVFVDAADGSERRVVRTDKDHAARSCSVDLDAPPEGLQALLERLGAVLVPLGL